MAQTRNIEIGADVLHAARDEATSIVVAQLGDVVGEDVDADNAEWWQHVGLVSLPPAAEPGKAACQCVVVRDTGNDVCVASRDLRGQALAGQLKAGETCVYAAGTDGKAQARSLWKADGSQAHVTFVGNVPTGETVGLFIQPSGNVDAVAKDAALLLRPSDISLFSPSASLSLEGGALKGYGAEVVNLDAPTIVLGGAAARPTANQADLDALILALSVFADAVRVVEGTNSPPPTGAATFVAAVEAFKASLTAIQAGMAMRKTRNQ